jgi:hypothetical protein
MADSFFRQSGSLRNLQSRLLLWLFFDGTRKKEVAMKRFFAAGIAALFILVGASSALAGGGGIMIPNPVTGEVVKIGSTADEPPTDPPSEPSGAFGSAPQSGDGIPDGSGLDSPNGPNAPK